MDKEIELEILNITDSMAEAGAFAMLLGEKNGERQMPIIIGPAEAQATLLELHGIRSPRPLTHDLFVTCLESLQSSVDKVLIYKAKDGIFYSYLYLKKEDEIIHIDSRTSDAIALALRFNCPIYIYESILESELIHFTESLTEESEKTNLEKEGEEHSKDEDLKDKDALENALEKAIKDENYELAAQLRDQINLNQK